MGATLLLGKKSVYIDFIDSKHKKYRNKVTKFPVEDGSPITDDIINENPVINIKGIVSASPITFLSSLAPYSIDITSSLKKGEVVTHKYTSPQDAEKILADFCESRKTITLAIDDEQKVHNAAIADLDIKSDSDTGDSLFVELKLEIIKKVVSKTTTVPENIADQKVKDDHSKKGDLGNVAAKPVDPGTPEYQFAKKVGLVA